jgi:hypothetical protein
MGNKKNKIYISTLVIFWLTVVSFIVIALNIYAVNLIGFFSRYLFYSSIIALFCLGTALIILAAKAKFTKISKTFFILTGAPAIGMIASLMLHNLAYALLIKFFGEGIWSGMGNEPVFFVLATIVCPLVLVTGIIGGIILIARKKVVDEKD